MAGSAQKGEVTLAVAVRRYFEVLLYLLIFTGFGTLASTGRLDIPTVVLVTAALLYRGYVLATRRQSLLTERWTNLLTIACVVFFVADEFAISRNFLPSTVHLILFVMLVRLFSAQRDRDHYLLAILSFVMVLAAAVLTVDSTFLLALAVFVLVAVAAFMLMEMMHSVQRSPVLGRDPNVHHAYRKLSFTVATLAPVLVALIFIAGAFIFFLLPRVSAGYLSAYSPNNDISTGFSDRVELGRIGQIQQSRTVVMHVQVDGDAFGQFSLKLRGITLNAFDGVNWSNTREKIVISHDVPGRFSLLPYTFPTPRNSASLHYRVTMEPLLNDVFFLLPHARSLQGNYRMLSEDAAGDVFNLDNEHPISHYEADSEVRGPRRSRAVGAGSYPPEVLANYLQLPPLDPRTRELATQITKGSVGAYDRANAIENYLRLHYGYTLQLPAKPAKDPVANFLFVRRQGHCEYFASAMAIMLRSLGIPARVVNGFAGGEFNDITSQYVIRASDAHSWVEAYLPGEGWLEFDPTPPGTPVPDTGWRRLALYMDAMASFWREWVVNYDLGHQLRLTQDASRGSRALIGQAQSWSRKRYDRILAWARHAQERMSASSVKWGVGIAILAMMPIFAAGIPKLLSWISRLRIARTPGEAPAAAATIWYERMLRLAAKKGWEKSPAQTPLEFAGRIGDEWMKARVLSFTRHYEKARFGKSAEAASELRERYEEIKLGS
jgi:transglutaminase-like putative cysteine protease